MMTMGKRGGLVLNIGELDLTLEAHRLGLGGLDIILGVVWLETLGKVTMDWKDMSMVFNHRGKESSYKVLVWFQNNLVVMGCHPPCKVLWKGGGRASGILNGGI